MMFSENSFSSLSSKSSKKILLNVVSCIGLLSLLAGCADRPAEHFSPPDYSYLPKMNLNIAQLHVYDNAVPKRKSSLVAKSPSPPDQSLTLMAHQRLNPTGNSGTGTFTVTDARISRNSDNILVGNLSVSLILDDPVNGHHAKVTASVTHQDNVSGEHSKRYDLDELNRHLMDDMNVELEYQIRKNMGDWLTDATGTPLNAAIKSQSLGDINGKPGDSTAPSAQTPPQTAPGSLGSSPAQNSSSPVASAPSSGTQQLHSPPAGVLHLP